MVIDTPGNVSLLVSVTVPLMLIVCACNTLTQTGTVSDANGNYSIRAQRGNVLEFTFVGMVKQYRYTWQCFITRVGNGSSNVDCLCM